MNTIKREQLAAQIVAIMKADFERPSDEEMESILDRAKSQIRDSVMAPKMAATEEVSLDRHR